MEVALRICLKTAGIMRDTSVTNTLVTYWVVATDLVETIGVVFHTDCNLFR